MAIGAPQPNDPGWRAALRGLWWVLIPGQIVRQQRKARQADANGLTLLRSLFVSFVAALVIIEPVVLTLSAASRSSRHPISSGAFVVALALYGMFALTVPRLIEQPLDCSDDARLAGTYRTRFFLRMAFSQSVALLGFVGYLVTSRGWLYPFGLAFTAVGFLRLIPTSSNLAKDQEVLRESGCGRSLVDALATIPPPGPRRGRR
jgi:hypothetical protein